MTTLWTKRRADRTSRDSDGIWAGEPGFDFRQGEEFCLLHNILIGYGPPILLSNGY
jgi:hypothetical protein